MRSSVCFIWAEDWVGRHRRASAGGDGCAECPCCVATSMQRPRCARCPPMVDETLPRSPCLQRADEGHTVVDALGRTSYTPQPKVPRGISEPRSVGARIPMPWAGFLLGARGRPQPTGAFFHSLYVSVGTEPGGKCHAAVRNLCDPSRCPSPHEQEKGKERVIWAVAVSGRVCRDSNDQILR
jgi:hypothetical protein